MIPVPNVKIANDVRSNPNERTCDTLIGPTGQGGTGTNTLVRDTDFFRLVTIPAGTFTKGNTFVVALTGCVRGDTSSAAKQKCGATYDSATGNLGWKVVQLDRFVADSTKLGLQVLHLAQPLDGYVGAMFDGGVKNVIGIAVEGGAPNAPVANGIGFGALVPMLAGPQIYATSDYVRTSAYDEIHGYDTTDASTIVARPALSFHAIQMLTYGSYDGGTGIGPAGQAIYLPGANYTLILIGDPNADPPYDDGGANPRYDGHGVHFLMFPNDPPLPRL
jgi:hypothetical protein